MPKTIKKEKPDLEIIIRGAPKSGRTTLALGIFKVLMSIHALPQLLDEPVSFLSSNKGTKDLLTRLMDDSPNPKVLKGKKIRISIESTLRS